jgi:hypothetical protein
LCGLWLADISLRSIHGFQSHLGAIPTVAGGTTKSFRGMDIRLVQFHRLRQLLHAERRMASCATVFLRLSIQNGSCRESQKNQGNKKSHFVDLHRPTPPEPSQ